MNGIKEVEATRDAWSKAGHAMGDLQATAFALGCVLKDGEPADSERAMAQAGPRAAVMLHRAADEALAGLAPGVTMVSRTRPEMQGYINLARDFEKDAPYLQNHRGHLMYVKPEEKRFVSAELISATSFTASEAEIKQRIEALRSAGYTQFTIQLVPGHEHALADWARIHGLAKRSSSLEGSATTAPSCNSRPSAARMSSVTNGQVYDRAKPS